MFRIMFSRPEQRAPPLLSPVSQRGTKYTELVPTIEDKLSDFQNLHCLNKHLKLHALWSHTSSLLKSLETESLAVRTNILTEDFLSFLLPLNFNFLKTAFGISFQHVFP